MNMILASLPGFNDLTQTYPWIGFILFTVWGVYKFLWQRKHEPIPSMCGTDFFSSYAAATRFRKHGKEWLHSGYKKYRSRAFRIPQPGRWHILVTGDKLIEEISKAPDDALSITEGLAELFQVKFTWGKTIFIDRYHVDIVRNQFTRNLGALFSAIREEVNLAIEENIPLTNEWTNVKVHNVLLEIICRASNRAYVGAPLCRNPEFISLNIDHALEVAASARILVHFPTVLKPLAARLFSNVPNAIQKSLKHLRPIIEERQKKIDEHGFDYPDKPVDFLSWLLDEAKGDERSPSRLTNRLVHLNFVSIHGSSAIFTHALYQLASQPEYIKPLRNEIEAIVAREGWSKTSLSRMHKLDSFLKESARVNPVNAISLIRKAMKDFTFSDGTFIPKGALLSAATSARHCDGELYSNGDTFDGFRFSKIREQGGKATTNQFAATNPNWLIFGHGRHACPGRFFVANELKLIMAQLILTYDIKMKNEGIRPANTLSGFVSLPDTNAEVLFRRRQTYGY